jgi:hypothetical protein
VHDNRETSVIPVGKGTSRPVGEGDRHTAHMHVAEESDHAKVRMKLLNKEGKPSAEVVAGRLWPKENIARSNTAPTQSGRRRMPGVGRCAAGSLPPTSEGRAVHANERPYGSVRGGAKQLASLPRPVIIAVQRNILRDAGPSIPVPTAN